MGSVIIKGLSRYDRIADQGLAPFKPGDPYRRDQLLAFQTKLQKLPQFSSAVVNIEPDPQRRIRQRRWKCIYRRRNRSASPVGAGYSSNTGARGEINYTNNNFLDRALRLNSGLRLEQKRQTLSYHRRQHAQPGGPLVFPWGRRRKNFIQELETITRKSRHKP